MAATPIDFVTDAPVAGAPEPAWVHGAPGEPALQVHRRDEHTYVLRQSKTVSYEGPFLFLLLGAERALLLDTGDEADPARCPVAQVVGDLVQGWLGEHPREDYELVVAHTHGHLDHRRGDPQFAGRPGTTLVGSSVEEVRDFFGFTRWPDEVVRFDLGGRVLEVVGIPGHEESSIAVHDPWTGLLLTGDTVYPGRLYVEDHPAYAESLDRLVDLAASRTVTGVVGCHVEMTRTPGRDYPLGCTFQPDEPPLTMHPDRLVAVRDAVRTATRSGPQVHDDFVVWNRARLRLVLTHRLRALRLRLTGRV